jgi:hypothetical protein
MGNLREAVKTQRSGFGIKRRRGNSLACEFDDADLIEQRGREIRPHGRLVLIAKRHRCGQMVFALLAQVGVYVLDSLCGLFSDLRRRRILYGPQNFVFGGRVELMPRTGGRAEIFMRVHLKRS